jgi:hypothetical protein
MTGEPPVPGSIKTGDIKDAAGVAIGHGAQAAATGAVLGSLIQTQGGIGGSVITADVVHISAAAPAGPPVSNRQAPPVPETYVPRPDLEGRLKRLLVMRRETTQVVALTGLPGTGKTLLARRVAAALEGEFAGGTLWTDLETDTLAQAQSTFIRPFYPTFEPAAPGQFGDLLARALGERRVLMVIDHAGAAAAALIPPNCPGVTALVISGVRLPGLAEEAQTLTVPEMTPEEAAALFGRIWRDAVPGAHEDTVRQIAELLYFLPAAIEVVARDVLNRQAVPADTLEELRQQRRAGGSGATAGYMAGFEAVYVNLPEAGRQLAPFLAVVGAGVWGLEALVTASQRRHREVEAGLRQLVAAGFVERWSPGRFSASPLVRDFALEKLRAQGGEALERAGRTLMAQYYLELNLQYLERRQLDLLKHFAADDANRGRLETALGQWVWPRTSADTVPAKALAKVDPSLADLDIVQHLFETLVLPHGDNGERWRRVLESQPLHDCRPSVREALRWALEQEDWRLVRRLGRVSLDGYLWGVTTTGEAARHESMSMDIAFWVIRELLGRHLDITSDVTASRLVNWTLEDCSLVLTRWTGVRLEAPTLRRVDMVGATLQGCVVVDGDLEDVDVRSADLRGTVFFGCNFDGVNFRNANLARTEFINATLRNVDFRGTVLSGIQGELDRLGTEQRWTVTGRLIAGDYDRNLYGAYD